MLRHKSVDAWLDAAPQWQSELKALRRVLLSTGLAETVKWGAPCYTANGNNVVGIGGFKSYFGLWFFQGALLRDPNKLLVNAQEGRTRAMRQWRMTSAGDIRPELIKKYVKEAAAIAGSGREIRADRAKPIVIPADLKAALAANEAAAASFDKMRPGLQREYTDYVSAAKRAETRQRRIDRILPMIAAGAGLNDKYR